MQLLQCEYCVLYYIVLIIIVVGAMEPIVIGRYLISVTPF